MEGRNLLDVVLNTDIAKKFNEVDKAVDTIQESMKSAAESAKQFAEALDGINKSFGDKSGFASFAENIQKLIESLNGLSANAGAKSIEQTKKGIESIGEAAILDIDSVQKLIDAINKLPEAFSKTSGGTSGRSGGSKKKALDNLLFGKDDIEEKKRELESELERLSSAMMKIKSRISEVSKPKIDEMKFGIEAQATKEIEAIRVKMQQLWQEMSIAMQKSGENSKDALVPYLQTVEKLRGEISEIQKNAATMKDMVSARDVTDQSVIELLKQYDAVLAKIHQVAEERRNLIQEQNSTATQSKQDAEYKKRIDGIISSIKDLQKQYDELKKKNKVFDNDGNMTLEAERIANQISAQKELLKIEQMSAEEAVKYTENKVNAQIKKEQEAFSEIKRLYSEMLGYEKKQAEIEIKGTSKEIQGKDFGEETKLAEIYQKEIDRTRKSIDELAAKYPELAEEAKKAYDTERIKAQIASSEKLDNTIDKTIKSVESLAEAERKQREAERDKKIGLVGGDAPRTIREYEIAIKNLRNEIKNLDADTQKGQINEYNKKIAEYKQKVDEATGATNRFRQENIKLNNVLQQVAGAFGVYIGLQAFTNLARRVRETTGEFELQHRALQAIIQDTQAANQIWDKTIKLAVRSPYNVKQLVTYTKQLAAYRVESDKLYDTTKMLADISSGLGVDMQRLILAYGQVKAANYLRGQELRQFSEAGINILGELAKYFTELKGQAVSTGQVFEMVSKRMVKFEDVAEVLHRLTEEGGAFYKMQEIQAETLSGIYANLKDRVDLALNSMGEDTRGILVGLAKAATFLLENWKAFSNMLTSGVIIWGFYKLEVLRAAMAKGAFTAATIQATAAEGGFIGMLAKSKLALKAFATSIKTIFTTGLGIAGVVIASLVAIGKAIYDHNKKIDEARKKYDELNQGINKNGISGFNRLNDAIQENNKKISENIKLRDKAKEAGEKEKEVQLQAEINQLQEKNNKLVDDIRGKYSELSDEIQTTAEGIVEIGAGAKELAHIQTMTTDLTNLFGENAGRRNDITETTKDLELAFNDLDLATSQFDTQFRNWINNVDRELRESTKLSDEFKQSIQSTIDNETLSNLQKYQQIQARVEKTYGGLIKVFGKIDRDYVTAITSAQSRVNSLTSSISDEVDRVSDKFKEMYDVAGDKESAQKASEGFIKNLGFLKGAVSDFLARMFSEKLDINVQVNVDDSKKQLLKWQEDVNKFIEDTVGTKKEGTTIPISLKIDDSQEDKDDYKKKVKKELDDVKEIIRSYEDTTKKGVKNLLYSIDDYNNALSALPDIQALYDALGGDEKKKGGKSNPALELLNKQIEAIKTAARQYDEYRKMYSDVKAYEKTKEYVEGLFNELKIGRLLSKKDVFKEGTIRDNIGEWLEKEIAAAGKDGKIAIEKLLRDLGFIAEKEGFKELTDAMTEKMKEAFDKYELGRELEKIGLGKEVIKSIFDIDSMNLVELKSYLEKLRKEVEEKFGDQKGKDWYENQLKKINEMQLKELESRMKRVSEYIVRSSDKILHEQEKGLYDIAFGEQMVKEGKMTASQFVQLVQNVSKDVNDAVGKIRLDAFKDTDTYIAAMGNLSAYTTEELKKLAEALREVISQNSGQMTADEMEEYYKALQKVTKKINDLDKQPFGENVFARIKKINQINEEINRIQEERVRLLEQEEQIQKRIAYYQQMADEETDEAVKQYWLEQIVSANQESGQLQSKLGECSAMMGEMGVEMEGFAGAAGGAAGAVAVVDAVIQEVNKGIIATVKTFEDLKDMAESFGVETNEESWRQASNFFNILSDFNENAYQGWEDLKSGNIFGAIQNTISSIVRLIKNINLWIDSGYQEEIEKLQDRIEYLEYGYDRLQKAADKAFDIQSIKENTEALKENINARIKEINAQIAAEESKKNPDDEAIEEWKKQITSLNDDLEDATNEFLEKVGGIGSEGYGDAAQGFVDAWFEAFNETGDGLEGLEKHFDEFVQNVIKRQALVRLANQILEPLFKDLDKYLQDGILSTAEYNKFVTDMQNALPQLNEVLKQFAYSFGLFGDEAEGTLTGLQKGIQGVTEQTAEIIAAYMNAIRYYVIDNNTKLGQIISALQDSTGTFNPMVAELRNIRQQAEDIRDLLFSWRETGGVPSMRVTIV